MELNTIGYLTVISLTSSLFLFLVLNSLSKKNRVKRRIEDFIPNASLEEEMDEKVKKINPLNQIIYTIAKIFKGINFSKKTEQLLIEAGSTLKPEDFLALKILSAAGIGSFIFMIWSSILVSLLATFVGFLIPSLFMKQKRKKRLNLLSYQLIETLGMMANSMRAGFSFMQAMQLAGKEMPAPLGPEFERVVRESSLGVPLEEVLIDLADRLPNKELEVVVQAILSQRKSGGNLAELMEKMEDTIRGRVKILEELNTLTAQGKMSSWIITLLPVCLGLYLNFMSKDYFGPMLEHPLGWLMLFISAISLILGWVFIQKIIRIEV